MNGFHVSCAPGRLVLSGEIDLAARADILEAGAAALNDPDQTNLIVDLAGVTFIDSTAIGALVGLGNAARARDGRIILSNVPPRVSRVLQIAGLDSMFGVASV